MSPETQLLELIEITILPGGPFEGTLTELKSSLFGDPTFGRQAEKLLYFNYALQTYMRRLHGARPDRISKRKSNSKITWKIQ